MIEDPDADPLQTAKLIRLAFQKYKQAFSPQYMNCESAWCAMDMMGRLAKLSASSNTFELSDEMLGCPEGSADDPDVDALPRPEQCYGVVMDLVQDLAETQNESGQPHLVSLICEYNDIDDPFFKLLARAARATDQISWLQSRYRDAITAANKRRLAIVASYLGLCLALLYTKYSKDCCDGEKAVRIWENIGTQGSASTRQEGNIGYIRIQALGQLGNYCLCKALDEESAAARWIDLMERHQHRKVRGSTSLLVFCLASWHTRQGRLDEARKLLKPAVKSALAILSDDDPTNDREGYLYLAMAFLPVGDETNALAVLHSQRQYIDGVAVLANDTKGGDEGEDQNKNGDEDVGNSASMESGEEEEDAEDTDDGPDAVGECDGVCDDAYYNWDGVQLCMLCGACWCRNCFQLLQSGELPLKVCGAHHDFLLVPVLEQKFKEGELLVGKQVVSADKWKASIKKQWGL